MQIVLGRFTIVTQLIFIRDRFFVIDTIYDTDKS